MHHFSASFKTFHSPLSSTRCGTQRRALPCYQAQEIKILINNNSFSLVAIEPTTVAITVKVSLLATLRDDSFVRIYKILMFVVNLKQN